MAFLASVFFAIANYITADLSLTHGIQWMFPSFVSSSIIWVLFHIYNHRQRNKDGKEPVPFFSRENSIYYKKNERGELVLDWLVLGAPIRRTLVETSILILLAVTFQFADQSKINSGIITSLFATSLVFTSVYFYFAHSQKLTKTDALGILMMIACIVIISLSEGEVTKEDEDVI